MGESNEFIEMMFRGKKTMEYQKRIEQKEQELLKTFKENDDVRKVWACIAGDFEDRSPLGMAMELGVPLERAMEICRMLEDRQIVYASYWPVRGYMDYRRDLGETFRDVMKEYLKRAPGDWYRDSIVAALKGEATEQQKKSFELVKQRWEDEQTMKALRLENAMLRTDLKVALARPEDARGQEFLKTFAFAGKKTLSSAFQDKEQPDDILDKAYAFCKSVLSWDVRDVKDNLRAVQNARRERRKKSSLQDSVGEMLVKMAEAYVRLYEMRDGRD